MSLQSVRGHITSDAATRMQRTLSAARHTAQSLPYIFRLLDALHVSVLELHENDVICRLDVVYSIHR
jgi:hypothetical protein